MHQLREWKTKNDFAIGKQNAAIKKE